KHWQTLQQNLPGTPVTDIYVKNDDLVVSTMGRSFWIMDDVAPLRQIAASVMKTPARSKTTDQAVVSGFSRTVASGLARTGASGFSRTSDVALAAQAQTPQAATPAPTRSGVVQPSRPAITKPFDQSGVFLFTPAATYRTHYVPVSGRP